MIASGNSRAQETQSTLYPAAPEAAAESCPAHADSPDAIAQARVPAHKHPQDRTAAAPKRARLGAHQASIRVLRRPTPPADELVENTCALQKVSLKRRS